MSLMDPRSENWKVGGKSTTGRPFAVTETSQIKISAGRHKFFRRRCSAEVTATTPAPIPELLDTNLQTQSRHPYRQSCGLIAVGQIAAARHENCRSH